MTHAAGRLYLGLIIVFAALSISSAQPRVQIPPDFKFQHPALLNNLEGLTTIRQRAASSLQPQHAALAKLAKSPWNVASLDFLPEPVSEVSASFDADQTHGTENLLRSAYAAYAHALQGFILQDERHYDKSVEILNAWSAKLTRIHKGHDGSGTGNQGLYSGWTVTLFCRAAEIVRHTSNAWKPDDIAKFSELVTGVFLPNIEEPVPTTAGNWELTYVEGTIAIAIFTDDSDLFRRALLRLERRIPLYFYLPSDGPFPSMPEPDPDKTYPAHEMKNYEKFATDEGRFRYWYRGENAPYDNAFSFYPGQCQETCRDLVHAQMGLAAAINSCEMAHAQGIDLYTPFQDRLTNAMEFCAKVLLDVRKGVPTPDDLCGGKLKWADRLENCWEIGFTHFHHRLGIPLPHSSEMVAWQRSLPHDLPKLHIAWETLTHGRPSESQD